MALRSHGPRTLRMYQKNASPKNWQHSSTQKQTLSLAFRTRYTYQMDVTATISTSRLPFDGWKLDFMTVALLSSVPCSLYTAPSSIDSTLSWVHFCTSSILDQGNRFWGIRIHLLPCSRLKDVLRNRFSSCAKLQAIGGRSLSHTYPMDCRRYDQRGLSCNFYVVTSDFIWQEIALYHKKQASGNLKIFHLRFF